MGPVNFFNSSLTIEVNRTSETRLSTRSNRSSGLCWVQPPHLFPEGRVRRRFCTPITPGPSLQVFPPLCCHSSPSLPPFIFSSRCGASLFLLIDKF